MQLSSPDSSQYHLATYCSVSLSATPETSHPLSPESSGSQPLQKLGQNRRKHPEKVLENHKDPEPNQSVVFHTLRLKTPKVAEAVRSLCNACHDPSLSRLMYCAYSDGFRSANADISSRSSPTEEPGQHDDSCGSGVHASQKVFCSLLIHPRTLCIYLYIYIYIPGC